MLHLLCTCYFHHLVVSLSAELMTHNEWERIGNECHSEVVFCLFREQQKEPAHGSCKKSHFWRQIISTAERKWVISLILWIFFCGCSNCFLSISFSHSQFYNLNFSSSSIFANSICTHARRDGGERESERCEKSK